MPRPIASYSTKGKIKAVYSKIALTENEGYDVSNVRKVALGIRPHALNTVFRFLSKKEIKTIESVSGTDFGKVSAATLKRRGIELV